MCRYEAQYVLCLIATHAESRLIAYLSYESRLRMCRYEAQYVLCLIATHAERRLIA